MAEIEQYLENFLKLEQKFAQDLNITPGQTLTRHSNQTYKLQNDDYLIKGQGKEMLQYATFYWLRLQSLKPHVKEYAEIKWEKDNHLTYVQNILDIRPNQMTVIIGTLFKEMPLKPCILKNIMGTLGTKKFKNGLYVSEGDYAVLEDSSGRIRIKKNEIFNPDLFVTGSIVALKGIVDTNGFFLVRDYCYAGIPFQKQIPKSVNINLNRSLYDGLDDPKREFVAFVSGLEFGEAGDVLSSELLLRFMRGELGGPKNAKLASQISRVVVCGNSIVQPPESDSVFRGSYRTQAINQKVYSTISEVLDNFEHFLDKLSQLIDVDVMPGHLDFSSSFLPQQPLNPCLFPQLEQRSSLNLTTNPHRFELNGLSFLGTSGQNVLDIFQYTKNENYSEVEAMQMTLEMRHICPTAPDTLRAFPFVDCDPFIINECPHVYFAGNMARYEERLVFPEGLSSSYKQAVKIISVPVFRQTSSIVLVDMTTLQSYEVKFELSEGVQPVRDSAMEDVKNRDSSSYVPMEIE